MIEIDEKDLEELKKSIRIQEWCIRIMKITVTVQIVFNLVWILIGIIFCLWNA